MRSPAAWSAPGSSGCWRSLTTPPAKTTARWSHGRSTPRPTTRSSTSSTPSSAGRDISMADEETLRDYLKRATTNLHDARQRLRDREDREHEPVAIVGMGCRFPGGGKRPDELWELVAAGGDAIAAFPGDRGWDSADMVAAEAAGSGGEYARQGGFLYGATE